MPVASLSAIVVLAAVGRATVGASVEASAGLAPMTPSEPAEPALIALLAPFVEGELASRRNTLTLRYTPSLRLRVPSVADTLRPLLLHHATVGEAYRLTPRTTLRGSAVADYGAVDYTDVREVVGGDESTNIRDARLDFVSVSSSAGVTRLFSRRWQTDLGIEGHYREPVSASARAQMATSYGGAISLAPRLLLSQIDTLELPASFSHEEYDSSGGTSSEGTLVGGDGVYDTVSVAAAWARLLASQTRANLSVGAVVSHRQDQGTSSSPIATSGIAGPLGTVQTWRLSGTTAVSWTAQLDPITARFRPAIGVSASLRAVGAPWTLDANVAGYTAATRTPLATEQPESSVSSTLQASRAYHRASLSFGVRGSLRASHLAAPTITASDPQLLGFVGVEFAQPMLWGLRPGR